MYVVAREFKADGRLYRPGDPCPEAANWPTLRALLASGRIKRAPVEAPTSPGSVAPPAHPREPAEEAFSAPVAEGREVHGQGGRRKRRG